MLPRNNITKKSSKNANDKEDNYKEFRENINSNIEQNLNKPKQHGYEHHQLAMKKSNVNNIVNHNNSLNVHRPTSYENMKNSPVQKQSHSTYHSNNVNSHYNLDRSPATNSNKPPATRHQPPQ